MGKGTAHKCTLTPSGEKCCGRQTLAFIDPDRQSLAIRARGFGTYHETEMTLGQLVHVMDPTGTSFTSVDR